MISKKNFLVFFLCFALFGCRSKENKKKLVLYTDTPESLTLQLTNLFEKTHGIEVEEVMEGTSWLMSRMRAEKAYPIADVFMGASGTVPGVVGAKEDLFESYTPKEWENMPVRDGKFLLRDQNWKWVTFGFASLGLAYSKKTLQPQDLPKTWENLADPQWKGEITIWDPSVSGTATLFIASCVLRYVNRGETEGKAMDFLRGFYKNIKKYAEDGPPAFSVNKGIVKLGIHLDNQFIFYKNQLKDKTDQEALCFYLPNQSAILSDPVALVAHAPHPEEAKLFIDFLLTPEAQKILSSTFWIRSKEGKISLPESHPYAKESAGLIKDKAMDLDFNWLAANFDRIRVYWQNHVEE